MRVVCAPDSFKESMSALVAAQAMAEGVRRVLPDAECVLVPMADGGEGTVEALADALGGELVAVACHDALGRPIAAQYAYVSARQLAVIEIAAASGLERIARAERDVAKATTYGTGELLRDALDRGARHFIIGLGGSATNDAGAGLFTALGAQFRDAAGRDLPPGGAALAELASVDLSGLDPRLTECAIEIACDVQNPLLGAHGASAVFGPQKGASPELVKQLDDALTRWADAVEAATGRSVREVPGTGAAGGVGAAFAALTHATMRPGVQIVTDAVGLRDLVKDADLVLTGEGAVDFQTQHGKTPWGVASVALAAGVPVIIFAGRVAAGAEVLLDKGVTALVPIVRNICTLDEALANGAANLADAVEMAISLFRHQPSDRQSTSFRQRRTTQ